MYNQLTKENRIELAILLKDNTPLECADKLGFTKRAINGEIERNKEPDGVYRGASAHRRYLDRRKESKEKNRIIQNNKALEKHIIKRLKKKDSPEQIAGRINNAHETTIITHPTIYTWIYEERPEFIKYLRIIGHKGKYRRRRGTRAREKQREEAKVKRIDTRPEVVEKRERLGDWEGDTIVGKDRKKRLISNVDRKSGYGLLDGINDVNVENVHGILEARFKRVPKDKKHTFTYDNGTEIGKDDGWLEGKINMDVYRAYPYHSWERGSNENYNGLVRDFFPKGTDFANLTKKEIKRVERILNSRPRKRLNYLTPHEVFVKNMDPDDVGRFKL